MVELTNVRAGRIIAVPYRDGQPGTPYVVPSGCVVERLEDWRRHKIPADLPCSFALDGRGKSPAPDTPGSKGWSLHLTGVYRMPSGEPAAVYGAEANRIN